MFASRWRLLVTAGAFAVLALVILWFARTAPDVIDALGDFDTRLLPAIALLVLGDYTLRFARWRWLPRVKPPPSLAVSRAVKRVCGTAPH